MRCVPAVLWTVVVLSLSLLPPARIPGPRWPGLDKVVHGVEFFVLAVLVSWALARGSSGRLFLRLLAAAPIMALLAGLTELLQSQVPGRSAEVLDLVADLVGILLGVAAAMLVAAMRDRSSVAG